MLLGESDKSWLFGGQRTLKPIGSNSVLSMKLEFRPPIATSRIVYSHCPAKSSYSRPHGPPFFRNHRGSAPVGAGHAGLRRRLLQSDGSARRHRAVTRRQDGLYY